MTHTRDTRGLRLGARAYRVILIHHMVRVSITSRVSVGGQAWHPSFRHMCEGTLERKSRACRVVMSDRGVSRIRSVDGFSCLVSGQYDKDCRIRVTVRT